MTQEENIRDTLDAESYYTYLYEALRNAKTELEAAEIAENIMMNGYNEPESMDEKDNYRMRFLILHSALTYMIICGGNSSFTILSRLLAIWASEDSPSIIDNMFEPVKDMDFVRSYRTIASDKMRARRIALDLFMLIERIRLVARSYGIEEEASGTDSKQEG